MKLNVDSYFSIGKTHKICEDYAATYQGEQGTILALSDGCSSSPNTDIGSRLLTRKAISLFKQGNLSEDLIIWGAQKAADDLGIPDCTDATLLLANINNNGELTINVWGDGAVFFEFKDGSYQLMTFNFTNNMPAYLSYLVNEKRLALYMRDYGDRIVDTYNSKYGASTSSTSVIKSYGWQSKSNLGELKKILLISDGIQSFKNKETHEPIPAITIAEQLAAIKNPIGFFMVRRMRKFLAECGWIHDDDLSVAALVVED